MVGYGRLRARAQSRGIARLACLRGGASVADRLACAGAAWQSGLDPPTQGGEKCERWSCQHLQVASNSANSGWAVCASTRPRARTRAAGAAVLCSARAPACRDCPGQRPEVAARAVAITPLRHWYDKTYGQPYHIDSTIGRRPNPHLSQHLMPSSRAPVRPRRHSPPRV